MSPARNSPSQVSLVKTLSDDLEFDRLLNLASTLQPIQRQQFAQDEFVQPQPSSSTRPLSATIVSSPAQIAELAGFVHTLAAEPGMLAPGFFLASVSPRAWRPCVVVVSQEQRIAGLFYCKERVVAGIGTRLAYGDDALGAMVAAHPEEEDSVIRCAIKVLLKHMVGLRLWVPPNRLPLLSGIQANADVSFCRAEHHGHLELPRTYDAFLVKLGPRTRRNLR